MALAQELPVYKLYFPVGKRLLNSLPMDNLFMNFITHVNPANCVRRVPVKECLVSCVLYPKYFVFLFV